MTSPLLSIILTSYNYECYLTEAIESVLCQDYEDYELIIIDDGSSDKSPRIIQKYAEKYPQIRTHLRKENRGAIYTINEAIDLATGRYVHWFSADDKYLPGFLRKTLTALQAHPDMNLAFSDFGYFRDDHPDQIFSASVIPNQHEPIVMNNIGFRQQQFEQNFWIPGHTTIFKRSLIKSYGYFDPRFEAKTDWMLYHTIALCEGAIYIPETLVALRQSDASYGGAFNKDKQRIKNVYKQLLTTILSQPDLQVSFRESCLLSFVFKRLFWTTIWSPRLWPYYFALAKRKIFVTIKKMRKNHIIPFIKNKETK